MPQSLHWNLTKQTVGALESEISSNMSLSVGFSCHVWHACDCCKPHQPHILTRAILFVHFICPSVILFSASDSLSSSILSHVGRLTSLEWFLMGHNHLEGSLPSSVGLLLNLTRLALEEIKIHGAVPSEMARLGALEELQLQGNCLSGELPPELLEVWAHNPLNVLSLSENADLVGTTLAELCNSSTAAPPNAALFACSNKLCGCDCRCGQSHSEGLIALFWQGGDESTQCAMP